MIGLVLRVYNLRKGFITLHNSTPMLLSKDSAVSHWCMRLLTLQKSDSLPQLTLDLHIKVTATEKTLFSKFTVGSITSTLPLNGLTLNEIEAQVWLKFSELMSITLPEPKQTSISNNLIAFLNSSLTCLAKTNRVGVWGLYRSKTLLKIKCQYFDKDSLELEMQHLKRNILLIFPQYAHKVKILSEDFGGISLSIRLA